MKQTAVEWLHEKLATSQLEDMQKNINLWFQKAKEMEKEQVIDAYDVQWVDFIKNGEDYYNETFKK